METRFHFVCLTCGNEFDTGREPAPCPECGSSRTSPIKPCRTENIPASEGRKARASIAPTISPDFVPTPNDPGIYLAEDGGGNVTAVRLLDNGDVIRLGSSRVGQVDEFRKYWQITVPERKTS